MPRDHLLQNETFVARPRAETFAFFADARNLERITPPELKFEIIGPVPEEMRQGSRIDYRLGLFGVSFKWKTLISAWEPGVRFVDEQISGPYSRWVHTHSFFDADGGTRVIDEVLYRLPLYPFGEIAHPLVRRQLDRIFTYRGRRIAELLDGRASG